MNKYTQIWLTLLALIAFAANSLLCRLALKDHHIDPLSFTGIRILSALFTLFLFLFIKRKLSIFHGKWFSAIALFCYALFFSLAYVSVSTGVGALILFGSVQITMIGYGLFSGEKFNFLQVTGLTLALFGLFILFLPGFSTPSLFGSLMMVIAGISWGIYSILGKHSRKPIEDTLGNFLRSSIFVVILLFISQSKLQYDVNGILYAILSGALASGLGYAVWYSVLPYLKSTVAASVQLSVPIIASFSAILLLNESLSYRLLISTIAVLVGIAIIIRKKYKN